MAKSCVMKIRITQFWIDEFSITQYLYDDYELAQLLSILLIYRLNRYQFYIGKKSKTQYKTQTHVTMTVVLEINFWIWYVHTLC